MIQYVHQLASNFVCHLLEAWLIVYSGFIRVLCRKQMPVNSINNDDENELKQYSYTLEIQNKLKDDKMFH